MAAEKKADKESNIDDQIKALTKAQKETYDKLKQMDLKNVTPIQLVKAAQEFGANVDGAVNYLAYDDPDGGDDDAIGEPNFLTSLQHGNKVASVDKKQANQDNNDKDKGKEQKADK